MKGPRRYKNSGALLLETLTFCDSVRSWPDHILTLQHHTDIISGVHSVHSPCNFSDHAPLASMLKLDSSVNDVSRRFTSNYPIQQPVRGIDWSVLSADKLYFKLYHFCHRTFLIAAQRAVYYIMRKLICFVISCFPVSLLHPSFHSRS